MEGGKLIIGHDVEPGAGSSKTDSSSGEIRFAPNPNLSLNVGIKKYPRELSWLAAATGLALQLAVFAFGAVVTFKRQWKKNGSVPWAFWLLLAGSLLQCGGMFFCALLVERSAKERVSRRDTKSSTCHASLHVLQPGNQVIGDQTFDSFFFATDPKRPLVEYTTSWKDTQHSTQVLTHAVAACTAVRQDLMAFVQKYIEDDVELVELDYQP
jgi:hypothetical protein